jgi:nucleotide-binding universal stress UspA family protein
MICTQGWVELMQDVKKQTPTERASGSEVRLSRPCYPQVGRILLCLDGSPMSEQGLQPAVDVARALDVPLRLFHVLAHRGLLDRTEPADPMTSELRRLEAHGYLHDLCDEVVPGEIRTEVCVAHGHVVDNIIREAHREGPALVVLTRHGERGQLDHPLSSTAHEVIYRLNGPFLLVPTIIGRPYTDLDTIWKTVMVPLDGSVRAECALPAAESIARGHGAELLLFHAVPMPELSGPRPFSKQDLELANRLRERNHQAAHAYLERIRARLASRGVSVRTLVLESGPVKDCVAELLQAEDIGLVVACAHGATGSQSWKFGSLAAHLIENSDCALMLIQDLSESNMQRLTHGNIGQRSWTAWVDRLHHR